ncbi:MAG TPA: xanthine dehydrogenase family protein molybdopterin-binding subunit, partial [Thermoanaerobaculia bacterium]|nr:xanthine dehydrogenase family protein molybdopterin-binding subunit [Thermoanaerobaculia bacterium]
MAVQPVGERIKRNEDPRLLTGRALFVDDIDLPDMVHVAFVRSPHAHARLLGIDASQARQHDGVIAVYTAEDLGDYWQPGPLLVPPPPVEGMVFHQRTQVPLAKGKVRHVGEPVALVVAVSRYVAEDAAEEVLVDYEALPAIVDLEKALEPGAALIHEDVGSNMAAYVPQKKGDYEAARAKADVVVGRRFWYDRG